MSSTPHTLKNIGFAFALNLVFAVIQFIGGILTGSVAVSSNAIHDLADSLTLGLALVFEKLAIRKSNAGFSYGYRRLSLLSAVISGIGILVACAAVLYRAIPALSNPTMPNTEGMFGLAVLGIIVNVVAAWQVHKGQTINEKMLTWHLLEDVLTWVAVLLAAVIMTFYDAPFLDPLLSICIVAIIVRGVGQNLWHAIKLFLQGVPDAVSLHQLREQILKKVAGVIDLHDTHVWSLDGVSHVLTMHAVVSDDTDVKGLTAIKNKIKSLVGELGEFHITLEFETETEKCLAKKCIEL